MQSDLAPLGGTVGHQQQVANLGNLQRRAADARLVDQLGRIEQAMEVETVRQLRRYPRNSSVSCCCRSIQLPVTRGRELHHPLMSERRSRVNGQQLPQLVEFEHAFAGVLDGCWKRSSGLLSMVQERSPGTRRVARPAAVHRFHSRTPAARLSAFAALRQIHWLPVLRACFQLAVLGASHFSSPDQRGPMLHAIPMHSFSLAPPAISPTRRSFPRCKAW